MHFIDISFNPETNELVVEYEQPMKEFVERYLSIERFQEVQFPPASTVELVMYPKADGGKFVRTKVHESSQHSEDECFDENQSSSGIPITQEYWDAEMDHNPEILQDVEGGQSLDENQVPEKHFSTEGYQANGGDQEPVIEELRGAISNYRRPEIAALCLRAVQHWMPVKRAEYPYEWRKPQQSSKESFPPPPGWPNVPHLHPHKLNTIDLLTLTSTAIAKLSAGQLRFVLRDVPSMSLAHKIRKIMAVFYPGQGYEVALDLDVVRLCQLLGRHSAQIILRPICNALINAIFPGESRAYPCEGVRPPQWPKYVRHRLPAHLNGEELIALASTFIRQTTLEVLENALGQSKTTFPERLVQGIRYFKI